MGNARLLPPPSVTLPAGSRAIGGPFFEDLSVGRVFDEAPAVTITDGHTALHHALTGDRLRLSLDASLATSVTGDSRRLVSPLLVCNVAIGQSTTVTQRVLANLFYRGLIQQRPVFVGDTLRTTTEVVALKQNRRQPDRPPSGLAILRIRTQNDSGATVLDFWRCPMLPLRDPDVETGAKDRLDSVPSELDPAALEAAVAHGWDLEAFTSSTPGAFWSVGELAPGVMLHVEGRDTVTSAAELARLTLNLAAVHHDPAATPHGRRLVYGGHTIAIAGAHVARALPGLVMIIAWRACDHTGPVFEGDLLRTEILVEDITKSAAGGALVGLQALVWAQSEGEGKERQVLDWRLVGWTA